MTKISFVYFDVGGVFFNWKNVFTTPAKDFGVSVQDIDNMFTKYNEQITKGYITTDEFWQLCRKELKINSGADYNFLKAWISDYIPNKYIYDLSTSLHHKYKLGLISNIYEGMYHELIQQKIIPSEIFTQLILSCDVHMRKPDKEMYLLAEKMATVDPHEILFIDDSEKYIDIPKKLGWQTFFYNTSDPAKTNQELRKMFTEI